MRSDSVIELSQYLKRSPETPASSVSSSRLQVRRRRIRYAAAVIDAAVTVCIGAGFFKRFATHGAFAATLTQKPPYNKNITLKGA